MRWGTVAAVVLSSVAVLAAEDKALSIQFKEDDVGKLPTGWKTDKTGKGDGSVWKVVADETAPSKSGFALAQTAEGPGNLFNLCVVEAGTFKDVDVMVAFKAVRGKKDQGGGIVWRCATATTIRTTRRPISSRACRRCFLSALTFRTCILSWAGKFWLSCSLSAAFICVPRNAVWSSTNSRIFSVVISLPANVFLRVGQSNSV